MNEPIPNYWEKSLQALTFWVAYKEQYFYEHLLTEGAIVSEIIQLLSSNLDSSIMIQCERMYSNIDSNINDKSRADIVIGQKTIIKKGKKYIKVIDRNDIHDIVEIKRFEGSFRKIEEDFEKLSRVKDTVPNARLFQIIVGQKKLPNKLFTKNKNMKRNNIYSGTKKFIAIPRLSKKAYSTKAISERGVYAILIEII